jgi:hypothetical protein
VLFSSLLASWWCLCRCRDLSAWFFGLLLFGQRFAWRSWFWILMGRTLLIRVRELASSCGNFLGWVGDCSSSLKYVGCLSDLGLGDESWLGGVCSGVFSLGDPHIYGTYVMLFFFTGLCSSCTETWLIIYFAISKNK